MDERTIGTRRRGWNTRRVRRLTVGLTLGAVLFASVAAAASVAASHGHRLTAVGHATSYVTNQADPNAFAAAEELFLGAYLTKTATSTERIGLAALHCSVTGAAGSAFLCEAAFTLSDGKILTQVLFDEAEFASPTRWLAITGGTGQYRHARGEVLVLSLSSGDEMFTFDLD